jgi:hypothetical protein
MEHCISILAVDYLPVGDLARMRRCSKTLKIAIENDKEIWTCALIRAGYRHPPATSFDDFKSKIEKNCRICRECAQKKASLIRAKTRHVSLCARCTRIENSFSFMLTREEIKQLVFQRAMIRMTRKYSAVLKLLTPVKKTKQKAYLYWAHDVYKVLG